MCSSSLHHGAAHRQTQFEQRIRRAICANVGLLSHHFPGPIYIYVQTLLGLAATTIYHSARAQTADMAHTTHSHCLDRFARTAIVSRIHETLSAIHGIFYVRFNPQYTNAVRLTRRKPKTHHCVAAKQIDVRANYIRGVH